MISNIIDRVLRFRGTYDAAKAVSFLPSVGGNNIQSLIRGIGPGLYSHDRGLNDDWPDYHLLARYGLLNPYAERAINIVAQNMASINLEVYEISPETEDVMLPAHEASMLLDNSPGGSRYQFIVEMLYHLYFAGEIFIRLRGMAVTGPNKGRPARLELLRPDTFSGFIYFDVNEPTGFRSRLSAETISQVDTGDVVGLRFELSRLENWQGGLVHGGLDLTIDELVFIKWHNPISWNRGKPLLVACYKALRQQYSAAEWNYNLTKSGGRTPGYFIPRGLPPGESLKNSQVEKAERHLDKRSIERQMVNLMMVLTGDYDVKTASVTPKDADFILADKIAGRKIGTVVGVPSILMDDVEGVGLGGGSTIREAEKMLYDLTVLPLLDFILSEFNSRIIPLFGEGLRLGYDRTMIQAVQGDYNDKIKGIVMGTGRPVMTVNEGRKRANLDEFEDDKYNQLSEPDDTGMLIGQGKDDVDRDRDEDRTPEESFPRTGIMPLTNSLFQRLRRAKVA